MSLDIIGPIYDIDTTDPENPVSIAQDGWHVNSTEQVEGLDQYLVTPQSPRQVFWGADTYCYKFDSEEQALSLLGLSEPEVVDETITAV